jgi:uncharacterized protein HemY
MGEIARVLILAGAVLVVAGLVLLGIGKLPFLGKLPGDIMIKRENFTFYFPLATSVIIGILISLVLYLFSRFR